MNTDLTRLPPHDPQMEMGVLGCILLDPNQCMLDVTQKFVLGGKEFYDLRHQTIYLTLADMWDKREPIDLITVQQRLKDSGTLQQVGGIAYLSEMQDAVPSSANLSYYLEKVCEKAQLREAIQVCAGLAERAHNGDEKADELLSDAEKQVLEIRQKRETGRGETDISSIINQMADNFERAAAGEKPMGYSTGFQDFDNIMGTMKPQEMVVIAGTPSAGKTTLLYNIFYKLALEKVMTGLINLDTSAYSAIFRYSSLAGQVDGYKCEAGIANDIEKQKMVTGAMKINELRRYLKIRDDVGTESRLVAACRRMKQQGCQVIGIDFMQQLSCNGKSKYEKISRSAEVIKGLAKELNIPVIAISSLNRENAKEQKKPTMQDLNGSGDIEYHANKIVLLHCEDRESSVRDVEVNVAKNKDGRCGRFNLTMFAPQFRFENAAKIPEDL